MPKNTRKQKKQRGGIWPFTSSTPTPAAQAAIATRRAEEKAKGNLSHSKSRVANVLAKPSSTTNQTAQSRHAFTYTNKDRIRAELQEKIKTIETKLGVSHAEVLKGLEEARSMKPNETITAVREFITLLDDEISRVKASEAAGVASGIASGVASGVGRGVIFAGKSSILVFGTLTVLSAQLLLKAFRIWLAFLVLCVLGIPFIQFGALELVSGVLPNARFESTKSTFDKLYTMFSNNSYTPNATVATAATVAAHTGMNRAKALALARPSLAPSVLPVRPPRLPEPEPTPMPEPVPAPLTKRTNKNGRNVWIDKESERAYLTPNRSNAATSGWYYPAEGDYLEYVGFNGVTQWLTKEEEKLASPTAQNW
jgi:hypothetical protein